jgi:hypothetical protein
MEEIARHVRSYDTGQIVEQEGLSLPWWPPRARRIRRVRATVQPT